MSGLGGGGVGLARYVLAAITVATAALALAGRMHAWRALVHEGRPATPAVLDAVATGLAGRPVAVDCRLDASVRGYAIGGTMELQPVECDRLQRFPGSFGPADWSCVTALGDCGDGVDRTIEAMHVLAHESAHLSGIVNEWGADCAAYRRLGAAAAALGADAVQVAALRRYYALRYEAIVRPAAGYLSVPGSCQAA